MGAAATGVPVENVEEIAGHGLRGRVDGRDVLAGNTKLLTKFSVAYPAEVDQVVDSIVVAAVDGKYAGYLTVADAPKEDAARTVQELQADGITKIVMLSGDKDSITQRVAKELGINEAHGGLLPEDKARYVQQYLDRGPQAGLRGRWGERCARGGPGRRGHCHGRPGLGRHHRNGRRGDSNRPPQQDCHRPPHCPRHALRWCGRTSGWPLA